MIIIFHLFEDYEMFHKYIYIHIYIERMSMIAQSHGALIKYLVVLTKTGTKNSRYV